MYGHRHRGFPKNDKKFAGDLGENCHLKIATFFGNVSHLSHLLARWSLHCYERLENWQGYL